MEFEKYIYILIPTIVSFFSLLPQAFIATAKKLFSSIVLLAVYKSDMIHHNI